MAEAEVTSVECGFCCRSDEDMEKPKTLPCTHVHCLGCLTASFEIKHITVCPVQNCGEVVVVPLDNLPTYKQDSMECCDVCIDKELGNQPAVIYCITCEKKYCRKHEESHYASQTTHKKTNISPYGVQHKRLHSKDCVEHSDEPYTMGCEVCLSIFCVGCLSEPDPCTGGYPHKLISLEELVAALVEDDTKVQMVAKEEKLERLFKLTSKVSSEYDNNTREMLQLLRDARNEQPSVIRHTYEKLEDELRKKRQEKKVAIAEYLEGKVLTMWNQLRNQRLKIATILKCSHHVDIVKGFCELKVEIQKLLDKELPRLELIHLVELNEKGKSRDVVEFKIVPGDDMTIDSELGCFNPVPLPMSMKHLKTVQLPANPVSVCYYKGSVYILLEGHSGIVRVDSDYKVSESFISCYGFVGSVIVHKDRIYTLLYPQSGPYVVSVYDMSGSQITQWNVSSDGSNPMAMVSDQLIITDQVKKQITVYSLTGQVLKHVPCNVLGNSFAFICAAEDLSVIVSDGKSKVSRVNINTGDAIWSTSVHYPCGICHYGTQYVLIGRSSDKYIQIHDYKTGDLLSGLTSDAVTVKWMHELKTFSSTLVVAERKCSQIQFHQLS